jgi:hypothetical protein
VACPSGLRSTPRKRVTGNPRPRVQIPPPPPRSISVFMQFRGRLRHLLRDVVESRKRILSANSKRAVGICDTAGSNRRAGRLASPHPPTLDDMDMEDWAADSAEKIVQAVKQSNPFAFQIPEGATEDEAVTALQQHAQEHGLCVPDDDEARHLIRRTRQGTQGG